MFVGGGGALVLGMIDPRVELNELPELVGGVEGLGYGQTDTLGDLALRAEIGVALHRLVQIRRDEREDVRVRRVRRAVRDPFQKRRYIFCIRREELKKFISLYMR